VPAGRWKFGLYGDPVHDAAPAGRPLAGRVQSGRPGRLGDPDRPRRDRQRHPQGRLLRARRPDDRVILIAEAATTPTPSS